MRNTGLRVSPPLSGRTDEKAACLRASCGMATASRGAGIHVRFRDPHGPNSSTRCRNRKDHRVLVSAVLMLALTAGLEVACGRTAGYPGVTEIDPDSVQRLCQALARDCLQIDDVIKSSDGRELRLVFPSELVIVSPTGEARSYRKPGLVAWMNDDHDWVAWSDDLKRGFYVQTESSRTHAHGYPRFDSGGRYFTIVEGEKARLYRVKPYRHVATLPLGVVSGVFARSSLVFVVGPDRDTRRLSVYTYRASDTGVDFVTTRVIERPDGGASSPFYVSDIAASGELFTIHDVSDPPRASMSAVRVYETSSGRLSLVRTGVLPWATVFLTEAMQRRLHSKAPFTLTPAASSVASHGVR